MIRIARVGGPLAALFVILIVLLFIAALPVIITIFLVIIAIGTIFWLLSLPFRRKPKKQREDVIDVKYKVKE
jgi:hypothetical protein